MIRTQGLLDDAEQTRVLIPLNSGRDTDLDQVESLVGYTVLIPLNSGRDTDGLGPPG